MKNKGQALVEFIVILPILLLIIMGITDFGNILYKKYTLENDLDYVVDLYRNQDIYKINEYAKENDFNVSYNTSSVTTITLNKKVNVNTPLLNNILGKKYEIKVERKIYEE